MDVSGAILLVGAMLMAHVTNWVLECAIKEPSKRRLGRIWQNFTAWSMVALTLYLVAVAFI